MINGMISGVRFDSVIWNASGPRCTTKEELMALGGSSVGAMVTKTTTLDPREGNPKPKYYDATWGSINSNGFENLGYKTYIELSSQMKQAFPHKPFIVSTSGMKYEDNITMVRELSLVPSIDMIELNMSCPNIVGKPQIGYDFEASVRLLRDVFAVCKKPLGVKLPPYFDFVHFDKMASVLKQFPLAFVNCINSLGNGLVIDIEKEETAIKPRGGFGGIGGKYVKPTALANVRKFYELLDVPVIGTGGVCSGRDAFEHILAGATAVQVGTCYMQEGTSCFARIEKELLYLMQQKGYNHVDEFRGKLKVREA